MLNTNAFIPLYNFIGTLRDMEEFTYLITCRVGQVRYAQQHQIPYL